MLERLGYQVTSTTSSIEALELFRVNPDSFDLVFTDMTMPKLTGEKLASELMDIRHDIPVILCTGFSELIDEKKIRAMRIRGYVMKPVVMHEMAETIREVLDEEWTVKASAAWI
jgi:CheY-like chemotaxis protein